VNPQPLQAVATLVAAFAALFGGLYAIVTRPLLKQLESIDRRLERIEQRLDHIETILLRHEERITRVEERTSPFRR
jgi:hypothetical protein